MRQMDPSFTDPPEPDYLLTAGFSVDVGEMNFEVIETPGHTPGGVCFYGHGLLFTGDTLFQGSIGRFDLPGGDGEILMESIIGKLMTLPDDTVVLPGHGPDSTIGKEKQQNPFIIRRLRNGSA